MADLDQPEPDTTGNADYDHDFERVDADENRPFGNEYPEEDSYDPDDQPESSQFPTEEPSSTIPTADLLSFGGGGDEQGEPEDETSPPDDPAHGHNIDEDLLGGFAPAASTEPESSAGDLLQTEKDEDTSPSEGSLMQEQPAEPTSTVDTEKAASPTPGKSLVVELVYWRDVKKSGVVFGIGLLILLALSIFSIISVVAYFLLALLTVTIGFRVYKTVMAAVQKSDESNPFKPFMEADLTLSQDQVADYSKMGVEHFNNHIMKLRHYLLVEDLVDSIKFAVFLYLLTYLGSWFNGLTLVMLAYILIFAAPVVYEKYQTQIDENINKVNKQVEAQLAVIKEKLPWLKKKEE